MFSSRLIMKSTRNYSDNIKRLAEEIKTADAVLIGAGAGLSTSAGFDKKRLFYTQGDYGLWQYSKACHNKTYDNKSAL